jgi:hypothetical protein
MWRDENGFKHNEPSPYEQIESNAHKVIMEHIEKLKPLPRKLN